MSFRNSLSCGVARSSLAEGGLASNYSLTRRVNQYAEQSFKSGQLDQELPRTIPLSFHEIPNSKAGFGISHWTSRRAAFKYVFDEMHTTPVVVKGAARPLVTTEKGLGHVP